MTDLRSRRFGELLGPNFRVGDCISTGDANK